MKTLWSFDSEDDSHGNVYLFNFFNGSEHFTFRRSHDALEFLTNLGKVAKVWAVNLQYDIANLFYHHADYCEIVYSGSRVISAKIPGTRIRFYDTLNHWKISVEEMGKRIDLEKMNVKGDFNNVEYCQRDSEITYYFVKRMLEYYQSIGAKPKSTIGSTSLNHFNDFCGHTFSNKNQFDIEELEFMERSLYGGRTECFYNREIEGNIQIYDFNSLYPSVLRDFPYPFLNKRYWTKNINLENEGIAYVTIKSPGNLYFPYLPYRDAGTLVFPLGTFNGHYTYFELREALKLGYKIEKIENALEFNGGTYYPFKNWVEKLYDERLKAQKAGDVLLSDTYKLIMNNLFGKFGQGNERTYLLPITKERLRKFNCTILENKFILSVSKGAYPPHTNFIWSSYCTAYARDRLFRGLTDARNRRGKVLYCDTDSIFVEASKPIFSASDQLGCLKLEGTVVKAHFKGLKNYKLVKQNGDCIYKVRGVPRKHAKIFFEHEIIEYRKPYRLREALRRNSSKNNIKNKKFIIPNYWEVIKKENRKVYNKRKVLKNGDTRAITIK